MSVAPIRPIIIHSCAKVYNSDLDKAMAPQDTVKYVTAKLEKFGRDIYLGAKRVDTGRLNIPVYMGLCGVKARSLMPTRKQMGKGSSIAQAQASAIMELVERFSFFSFWQDRPHMVQATWKQAKELFGEMLIPLNQILKSVHDNLDEENAEKLLTLHKWLFYPATDLRTSQIVWLPVDWFRMLGEFNGSSAGNTQEESLLQGFCELIERHVCAVIDKTRPTLPTLDQTNIGDPTLYTLIRAFQENGIVLILKDFSLESGIPTVGALAWDPTTFPDKSEIVFTAGTATSPAKAAIRAITEVAQLGGDFYTNSRYEASGLPKFKNLNETQWLLAGEVKSLESLPSISHNDIGAELRSLLGRIDPLNAYSIDITHSDLGIPSHYSIIPGLEFRERDANQSLGLFIGRKLAEEEEFKKAALGLDLISSVYPEAHFMPFFRGLLALRKGEPLTAANYFQASIPIQPDPDSAALAFFYAGYALTALEKWKDAIPFLLNAHNVSPEMKEAPNLLGVAHFKLKDYENAESWFDRALNIDKGSAMDLANRGMARKFQGKERDAAEDLSLALELDPTLDFAKSHLEELRNKHR